MEPQAEYTGGDIAVNPAGVTPSATEGVKKYIPYCNRT